MAIGAGATIGNYQVLSKIGTGGMGAVYLAIHPLIGKKVALKVIHRELASNREVVMRFFQEAQAVNKIGNEHIVEIHDVGVTPEGDHYYIMEYLEGRTLASVLTTDRVMDVMRALHVGGQIASALAAAHGSGVIHRDLKPDNIMLLQRGLHHDFVKVLDFGLAKMFQAGGASAIQTATGVLLGTPQYMSPEACESRRDVDHRTDIYALGILLFQMMCGRIPFDGDSMGEVLIKQVTALPPAPRGINPAIPPSVEQILLRSLAKKPDQRFQTMNAFRDALLDPERYLSASPPMAPARSVGPGEATVDARHVIAAAQAAAATRAAAASAQPQLGPARSAVPVSGPQRTMIEGAHLAPVQMPPGASAHFPVPAHTAPPLPNMPQQPKMNTMRIATPLGYSARPQRRVWPIMLAIGCALGLGIGVFTVIYFGKKNAPPTASPSITGSGSGSAAVKAAAPPDAAVAVAPPDAAVAVAPPDAAVAVAPPDAAVAAPPDAAPALVPDAAVAVAVRPDAAVAPVDAAIAPPADAAVAAKPPDAATTPIVASVKVTVSSSPAGAAVTIAGKAQGKTPITIDWPADKSNVDVTVKLSGFRTFRTKLKLDDTKPVTVDATLKKASTDKPAGQSNTGDSTLERPF